MRRLPLWIASLLPLLAGTLTAQEAGDPSARVARISYVTGTVSFQPAGDSSWGMATVNYPMTTGDRLYTDPGARAELEVGSLAVRASESTDLTVTALTNQFTQVGLTQGTLRITVYQSAPGDSVEIDTPRGALELLAPGEYRVDAPPDDSPMIVAVYRGTLQWTAGGVAQTLQGGEAIAVSGIGTMQVQRAGLHGPDSFDRWSADRDGRLASSASSQYVSRDTPGYADLDAAGSWQPDAEYGPVWYPNDVPSDWAPYRNGRWVWIEPWGWNWVEQEPWGYAPFHYGRWAYVGSRWGWLPGSMIAQPYYSPALVVFVDGSGFRAGAQAWFPLGPGEPYRPWYNSGARYQRRINVPTYGRVRNAELSSTGPAIAYRNRRLAMTVVPATTFRSGLPVARRVIPVTRLQITNARIEPRATAVPGRSAVIGGRAASAPPRDRRPTFVVAPTPRRVPQMQSRKPLVVRQNLPAPRMASPVQRNQPTVGRRAAPAPATPRVLITRRAPPPQQAPFIVRPQTAQPNAGRQPAPQRNAPQRVTRPNLPRAARPNLPRAARPNTQPAARPNLPRATRPTSRPAARPTSQPATRGRAQPRAKPQPQPDQNRRQTPPR